MDINAHNVPSTVSAHKGEWPDVNSLPVCYLHNMVESPEPHKNNWTSHLASKSLVVEITSIKSVTPKESKALS